MSNLASLGTLGYFMASGVITFAFLLTTFNHASITTRDPEFSLIQTEVLSDVFLLGSGYLVAEDKNQELYLAKGGRVGVNANEQLTLTTNKLTLVLAPPVQVPHDVKLIWINSVGEVKVTTLSEPDEFRCVGQLECARSFEAAESFQPNEWLKPQIGVMFEKLGATTENYIISGWRVKVSSP